jgi:hypothetical protein
MRRMFIAEGLLALAVYCITLIWKRHGHLGIHDVARLPSRLVFNPLTPSLGGDKRELGTPQTPVLLRRTPPYVIPAEAGIQSVMWSHVGA